MLSIVALVLVSQQNPSGLALPNTAKVADVVAFSSPSEVELGGLLGERYSANEHARLPVVDEDELLNGFRHRPGKQSWIGEHVGKWLHAASLTYLAHQDPALRAKMDRVVSGLLATQGSDGYLGTYPEGKRFSLAQDSDWDVWVHKYCMIGLLSYYQATHEPAALASCERIGELLLKTFAPGGQKFSKAGTHEGMAATSVLEPVVLLYRATGDTRYLRFARRIVNSFEEPEGSHLERDLLTTHSVAKSANGKAYEMLSNLVGLTELYRATGEPRYLKPVKIAWKDIVANRLYLTGSGSSLEHWTPDGLMPNGENANVGETCVTVTWMQLNLEMLRLTGESKYVDQVERSTYNHLLGSQRSDGAAWCYYSPLEGKRHPSSETTCCLSSGPRGIALLPTFSYASRSQGVDVNMYGPSTYDGKLALRQTGNYPFASDISLKIDKAPSKPMTLRLRIPGWVTHPAVQLNGKPLNGATAGKYLSLHRTWKAGDTIQLHFPMPITTVEGHGSNSGFRAYTLGPLVYAATYSELVGASMKERLGLGGRSLRRVGEDRLDGQGFGEADGYVATGGHPAVPRKVVFVPFYRAGDQEARYSVWLRTKPSLRVALEESPFGGGPELTSRVGNVIGSFADGDPTTLYNTYTNSKLTEDWYAVVIDHPATIDRVLFRHGQNYHDGGWFDTSTGKPKVQIRRTKDGEWETIGSLDAYPKTDAVHQPSLVDGQAFEFQCAPMEVVGVRVVGKPSHGDRPEQNFSSCAELAAFRPH